MSSYTIRNVDKNLKERAKARLKEGGFAWQSTMDRLLDNLLTEIAESPNIEKTILKKR